MSTHAAEPATQAGPTSTPAAKTDPLAGGGEMGALMRAIDWSQTAVGAVSTWPQSLRTALGILLDAGFPMYIAWGPDFTQFYNDGYQPILGSTKHPAAMGRSARQTFAEIWDVIGPMFQGVLQGAATTRVDFLLPLDRHGSYSPIRAEGGGVGGILVTVAETTDARAQAESLAEIDRARAAFLGNAREVEAARMLLETVVEQMPAGVIVAEAPSGRTLLANERVREILGHPALPTASIGELAAYGAVHPDGRPFAAAEYTLTRALAGELVFDEEILYRHADGTLRTLSASAAPVHAADGTIVAAVNAFYDVSDRKRAEAERQQLLLREREARAQAEIANRSKDEFLAMLGHELRNPLAPIVTALQLMRLRGDEILSRERTIIERQVSHLVRLVDDLLDVSRITRGKIELKRERTEISEIVAKAIEMASPLIEARRHRLTLEVPRQGLLVEADAVRLAQVVSNLLNNAAKYTEPHGAIAVRAARQGADVVLAVADSGIGLSPEILPHIFDLFVQERQALDRAQGGLGLGLAIVRILVELHGGTVGARSAGPGRGSELVVRLPAASAPPLPAAAPERERGIAIRPDALRVLVVDDNADGAELLAESVRLLGHVAQAAHDGPSGLHLAAHLRPDLAVLDIGLPVMDGYELAGHLRAMPGLESIRLVAVAGYAQEADRRHTAAAGFEQHLVKPIQLEQLEALLTAGAARRPAAAGRSTRSAGPSAADPPVDNP